MNDDSFRSLGKKSGYGAYLYQRQNGEWAWAVHGPKGCMQDSGTTDTERKAVLRAKKARRACRIARPAG